MSERILVVEDEQHLARGIADNLLAEGYMVEVVGDGEAAIARWVEGGIDLLVLDVMLPKRDGFAVCQAIRAAGGYVPVLFLTAKNSQDDRIAGLQAGGDDYLGKPFHLRELLWRVRAMLRRQAWYQTLPAAGQIYRLANKTIDFINYEVTDEHGHIETLPQKEMMILKMLIERRGDVVSRDAILDHVWGYDVYPSSRTIDNFIVRLRKRFEPNAPEPIYFHTVRGVGYRFVDLQGHAANSMEKLHG